MPFYALLHKEADFNGTVVVEWFNVTAGLDAAPDWIQIHTELIREGYAWVGVSAQSVGVEGGGAFDLPLKIIDAQRYGRLNHPGDSFSYDIFSQAAQAAYAHLMWMHRWRSCLGWATLTGFASYLV